MADETPPSESSAPAPPVSDPRPRDEEPTLRQLQRDLLATRMELARTRAMRDFPSLKEEVLNLYQGTPDGIYEYAKTIHQAYGSAAAPPSNPSQGLAATPGSSTQPAVGPTDSGPVPMPGPGAAVTPDQSLQMQLKDWRQKAINKNLDVKMFNPNTNEAADYFSAAVADGMMRLGKWRRKS